VTSVEDDAADEAPVLRIGGLVRPLQLVLDAEVLQLIQHVVGAVRLVLELQQELPQRRAADVPATGVVEQPLGVQELQLEGADVGAELRAGRPRLEQAVRHGAQRPAHHQTRCADGEIHGSSRWKMSENKH